MTECQICCENFNGIKRKKCLCSFCQETYCRECVSNWLTGLIDEPRCLNENCKKPWSMEYIDSIMTKVWRDSTYREYRKKLLMDREKALLPATQPRIEAINEARHIEQDIIAPLKERRKEHELKIRELQKEVSRIQTETWDLIHKAERLKEGLGIDEQKQRSTFIRRCPAEGCRGFLSTAWKCGTCELYSCHECQEVKGVARNSEHTCDPANIETAKLIAKDTKGCPKCGEMITKIDGCDQMWCVSCHTAFSWRTGNVANGVVHNPHYYEWQRRINNGEAPRNEGDVPCGGMPAWITVRRAVASSTTYPAWVSLLEMSHRAIAHISTVDMPRLVTDVTDNIDLRIQYLLKHIEEPEMMALLQTRETQKEKQREIRRVYETLVGASTDIYNRIIHTGNEKGKAYENFTQFINELDELRKFINDALDVLRRRYNCTLHGFDESWNKLILKKNKAGVQRKEIKSIYGIFNDGLLEYQELVKSLPKPKAEENGNLINKPYLAKLTKLKRTVTLFPETPSIYKKTAENIIKHYTMSLNSNAHSEGIYKDPRTEIYYNRMKDSYEADVSIWKTHTETLELIMKMPENKIIDS